MAAHQQRRGGVSAALAIVAAAVWVGLGAWSPTPPRRHATSAGGAT